MRRTLPLNAIAVAPVVAELMATPHATNGSSQINLDWTAPANNGGSGITSYKIERSNNQINWETLVEAFDDH